MARAPEIAYAAPIVPVRKSDAFYDRPRPRLDELPKGRVRPPFDHRYGRRDFHATDPDGWLPFFGENV